MNVEFYDSVDPDETHLPEEFTNVVDPEDPNVEVSPNQSPEPDFDEDGDE